MKYRGDMADGTARDLKLFPSFHGRSIFVSFTIALMDHQFFNSTFLGNGYHDPSGLFKNNITKLLVIHPDTLW
jgi:hypothetical protein